MMRLDLLRVAATILTALVCGLGFAHVLEAPAKKAYPAPLYVELQKSLYVQWGPPQIGGFLEPLAIAATGLLALSLWRQRLPHRFTLAGVFLLFLAFPVVFFLLVAPANSAFRAATPLTFPPNWADLRDSWEMGHALRFGLQFAALVSLVLALTFHHSNVPRTPTISKARRAEGDSQADKAEARR